MGRSHRRELQRVRRLEIPPTDRNRRPYHASRYRGFEFSSHDDPMTVHRRSKRSRWALPTRTATSRTIDSAAFRPRSFWRLRTPMRAAFLDERGSAERREPASRRTTPCAADGEGNMISYIQSNHGLRPGAWSLAGIAEQPRTLLLARKGHLNMLEPGKRPTIIIPPSSRRTASPWGLERWAVMQPQATCRLS